MRKRRKSAAIAGLNVNIKLRIDEELEQRLERLADKNGRTVAGEIRFALRAHVALAEAFAQEGQHLGKPWCGTVHCQACIEEAFAGLS